MQYNLSPDRLVREPPEEIKEYIDENMPWDTTMAITWMLNGNLDTEIFKKHDLAITPNGECWNRDSDGFVPKILNGLYAERSARKKEMLNLKQEIEDKKVPTDAIPKVKNEIARLDTLQMALKILMNSEYGAMANEYFRWFSLEIAEGITSSGQLAIQWVAKHLDIYLNSIMQTEGKEYVFYMDTDGLYVEFDTLVSRFFPDGLSVDDIVTMLDQVCTHRIEPEIDRIYDRLADYTNAHNQKMVMKREVIANKGIWTSKKRYALHVYDSEHVRYAEPKTKIMGLESVRSSIPLKCRNAFETAVKLTLKKDEDAVQSFVENFRAEFWKLPIEEIAFPRGVNNIEKWQDHAGMPKKSTPIHVRASIVFNRFLSDFNMTDIETIKSGDKIKYIYLKDENPLKSHVTGFPSYVPDELLGQIKDFVDYELQFEKTFLTPIANFLQVIGWTPEFEITLLNVTE
jgi:DNA polymerase elongation subunit (family B)